MKRNSAIIFLIFSFSLAVCSVFAKDFSANVTGKWAGSWQGRLGSEPITLVLRQHGAKLMGSLLRPQGRAPLSGTVDGDHISFTADFSGPRPFTILFKGVVEGRTIKGTSKAEDVGSRGAFLGHGGEIVYPDRPWTALREDRTQQIAKSAH